jgi:uncharacterized membrane protein
MEDPAGPDRDTALGLDANLAGALCYLLGFVSGIVFLVIERRNRFVRFHAYQAVGTFLPLFVLSAAAGVIPVIGRLVAFVAAPVSLILWIVLMVKAFQGERFELPVVGEWAARQSAL